MKFLKPKPRKNPVPLAVAVAIVVVVGLLVWYLATHSIPVFQPTGVTGAKERSLIDFALILSVIVVVPTFALTIYIVWKYREGKHDSNTKYKPDFDHSVLFESVWWGVPIIIIGILSVVTWRSAHSLDPYQKIASSQPALNIQVVSLDWKWLFIYPEQNVASVNYFVIPAGRPVHFSVTSDSVMNSFWVPSLGGQIMAMPGMNTQIYEEATKPGVTYGSSANISGTGFARMRFSTSAVSHLAFNNWISRLKASPLELNVAAYQKLAEPNVLKSTANYAPVQPGLFNQIIMQYMMPGMSLDKQSAGSKSGGSMIMPNTVQTEQKAKAPANCGNISPLNKEVFIRC
ncbi:MAG: COX aromatic rich motif-containing protein [Candidatus Saccharimonadales bacterium]